MSDRDGSLQETDESEPRGRYAGAMRSIEAEFDRSLRASSAGSVAVGGRARAVDELVDGLWAESFGEDAGRSPGISLVAIGGYGRRELLPSSDVDLMILLDGPVEERAVKEPIRRFNQQLWDAGVRAAPLTRSLAECGRFDAENVEFTLALLDARWLNGDAGPAAELIERTVPKLVARERKKIGARLVESIRVRHGRYGDTLFHLEPNVKECPGGLRDAHCGAWLAKVRPELQGAEWAAGEPAEFVEAREFLVLVRTFLHFRHRRDDNTLDWESQDRAAAAPLGISREGLDASYWMRIYFRHARAIERRLAQMSDERAAVSTGGSLAAVASPQHGFEVSGFVVSGFEVSQGRICLAEGSDQFHALPEHDPDVILSVFTLMAETGVALSRASETRLEDALPLLAANLEDGPGLWRHLQRILTGTFAGRALRSMHALGILELVMPEFHGIDALVIRDAYHRYTVDEHTFVLIDTLHELNGRPGKASLQPWGERFASILRDLPRPELLFLAALLHDTGKGHSSLGHAGESVRLAASVVARLELEPYESGLVLDLIRNHLEMSAALRRDVFDAETVRTFATRVATPEVLRMLTLFTYADIAAVHPDALTPWKAENLWRLHIATSNYLDRNVDDDRIASAPDNAVSEIIFRVHALLRDRRIELAQFLEGLPLRYLQTRTPDHIRSHFELAALLANEGEPNQLDFRYAPTLSELTLVTRDRPMLFASMAGALAAWGMNIVTADAFSNAHGVVVDSFRFIDTYRTLQLNETERERFVAAIRDAVSGRADLESLLAARRRGRRRKPKVRVETRIDFDDQASTQSTLLQVVAQDTPGLLRALAFTLAQHGCNIEVALVDTEGEMAIDVFYLTHAGAKVEAGLEQTLRRMLLEAIEANAR